MPEPERPHAHVPNRAVCYFLGLAIDAIDHAAEIASLHNVQAGEDHPPAIERIGEIEEELTKLMEQFPTEI